MIYLLDANVLITANNLYYPVEAVPEFWDWVEHHAVAGTIKMPIETYEEVRDGGTDMERDALFAWIRQERVREALLLPDAVDGELMRWVLHEGYAPDLRDDELEAIGRDPFLIAHALAAPADRCVVTTEVSSRNKQRQNRRIPDVCGDMGVPCCNTFEMLRTLRFTTRWRA